MPHPCVDPVGPVSAFAVAAVGVDELEFMGVFDGQLDLTELVSFEETAVEDFFVVDNDLENDGGVSTGRGDGVEF